MVESITLELEGPDAQTGAPMRRYRVILTCSCPRKRVERRTVPHDTATLTLTCEFCGDEAQTSLRLARPELSTELPPLDEEFSQETTCTQPECGKSFEFDYRRSQGSPLRVVCPHCGTMKTMHRSNMA